MDPKVSGKLLTTHGEAMMMMQKHSVVDPPSGGAPEKAPRWDLTSTEGCGGGITFFAPYLVVWGYVGIYRRKEYVGGATWAHEGGGRAQGVGAPPYLVASWLMS